jgi:hypothetical protein
MADQNPVIDRMQALVEHWEQVRDRRADFLTCYCLMTSNMLAAIEAGEFHDPAWVDALLQHFAEYYFVALEDYERGSSGTPAIWRFTFNTARKGQALVLQNLLLGINAHINYDLVLALVDVLDPEWGSLTPERRQSRYEDHRHVNDIIGRTVDSVQDQVVEPDLPVMRMIDAMLGPVDEWMASRLISGWRESVWAAATEMLDCTLREEREALRTQIEAEALRRAQVILISRDPVD